MEEQKVATANEVALDADGLDGVDGVVAGREQTALALPPSSSLAALLLVWCWGKQLGREQDRVRA